MNALKILSLDTSSVAASCALMEDENLRGEYFLNTKLNHSKTIMEMVSSLLKESERTANDIDVFACVTGPGSFTGLRIGIAAAKGMADVLNKPCVGVSALHGLAENLRGFSGYIIPTMDARCNQVYTATFKGDGSTIERISEDDAITIDELGERLLTYTEEVYLTGDGAKLCYDKLQSKLPNLKLAPMALRYSRGSSVAEIARAKYEKGEITPSNELIPLYLRLPQAERELKKANEKIKEVK